MNLIPAFLELAEAYSTATGVNLRLLSDRIFADRRRIEKLQDGSADLTTRSYEKAMLWFVANWPEGIAWPEGIERPELPDASVDEAEAPGAAA